MENLDLSDFIEDVFEVFVKPWCRVVCNLMFVRFGDMNGYDITKVGSAIDKKDVLEERKRGSHSFDTLREIVFDDFLAYIMAAHVLALDNSKERILFRRKSKIDETDLIASVFESLNEVNREVRGKITLESIAFLLLNSSFNESVN